MIYQVLYCSSPPAPPPPHTHTHTHQVPELVCEVFLIISTPQSSCQWLREQLRASGGLDLIANMGEGGAGRLQRLKRFLIFNVIAINKKTRFNFVLSKLMWRIYGNNGCTVHFTWLCMTCTCNYHSLNDPCHSSYQL